MKEKPHHYKLKNRLFISIAALVFLSVTLVSAIGSYRLSDNLVEQNKTQTKQIIDQLALNTSSYISELSRLCMSPYYNESLMKLLESDPVTDSQCLEKQREVESYLREVMTIPRNDILCVNILTDAAYSSSRAGHIPDYSNNYTSQTWYLQAIQSPSAIFLPVHNEKYGSYDTTVFSMVLRLQSISDSKKTLGVIRVDANYSGLKDVLDDVDVRDKGALYIFDSTGSTIYCRSKLPDNISNDTIFSSLQSKKENVTIDKEKYLLNYQDINGTDWTILAVNSESVLMKNVSSARLTTILLAIVCASLTLLITALFVRSFVKPFNQTIDTMRNVKYGDLSIRVPDSEVEEIAFLNNSFNNMLQTISETMEHNNELTKEKYKAEYLQKKAQYDALYNQIRPHFLFNTLSTLSILIKSGKNNSAIKCIDDLSILLRGMVNTNKEITLASELKIAESYLSLQERRHDSLTYSIEIEDSISNCIIPALTIQPIVENALIHGCEPSRNDMNISICAVSNGNDIIITITDNGVGIDTKQLDKLNKDMIINNTDELTNTENSVGLKNIAQRLFLRFNEKSKIHVESQVNEKTSVIIQIPKIYEEEYTV